jgi:hypothetical protein
VKNLKLHYPDRRSGIVIPLDAVNCMTFLRLNLVAPRIQFANDVGQ